MFYEKTEIGRSMMGLSCAEQLIVWGIRHIVAQSGPDPELHAEFQAAFGPDGEEALRIFCGFFRLLGQAARRPYEIAATSALMVTRDERRILTLLAAAQHAVRSGSHDLLAAHLLWLATIDHRPALATTSLAFARLLVAHNHPIAIGRQTPAIRPVMRASPVGSIDSPRRAVPN